MNGTYVLLAIYIDDLFISCDSLSVLESIKRKLASTSAMKDLGITRRYLGMDVKYQREKGFVELSQSHFVAEILKRFHMSQCKSVNTPKEKRLLLRPCVKDKDTLTNEPFRQLVG